MEINPIIGSSEGPALLVIKFMHVLELSYILIKLEYKFTNANNRLVVFENFILHRLFSVFSKSMRKTNRNGEIIWARLNFRNPLLWLLQFFVRQELKSAQYFILQSNWSLSMFYCFSVKAFLVGFLVIFCCKIMMHMFFKVFLNNLNFNSLIVLFINIFLTKYYLHL